MVMRAAILDNAPMFTFVASGAPLDMQVVHFSGHEGLSRLYEFSVDLACEDSVDPAPVGKAAVLNILGEILPRHVHGIISRFEYVHELAGRVVYRATVVPKVWRLQYRHNSRIFQQVNTPQIIQRVLKDAGLPSDSYRLQLSDTYDPRDYCVQYRESDWNFLSRLMEEDGIFYFFEHHADKHVIVFGDGPGACQPIAQGERLPFYPPSSMVNAEDHVSQFQFVEEIRPGRVSLRDFNFKKPALPMEVKHNVEDDADLEVYDYPGEYQDPGRGSPAKGATIAKIRLDESQASRAVGHGESDCERFQAGCFFALTGHSPTYDDRYLIMSVSHSGNQPQALGEEAPVGAFGYANSFSCIPADTLFRPPRTAHRPMVRGIQTAIVVGPANEEIYVDEFGRVKVQFHWDREGKNDEKSSCWIRVSQPWAGEIWGGMFIPRIGQEVIVSFIEGDPDRPIITGRVYNGQNLVPYKLPHEKTKSSFRSNSSPGGGGFNELRFEDSKGSEQLFMHAQKNMDVRVLNDSMETILHDRHQSIGIDGKNGKVGDQNEEIFRDKSLKIHRNHQEHIGGDMKLLVGGVDGPGNQEVIIQAERKELVKKDAHLHVEGNQNEKVDKTWSVTVGGDLQMKVTSKQALDAGQEIHLKSAKIVIEASTGVTVKGPGGFITIDASGIAISGSIVNINSGGSALPGSGAKPTAPVDPTEAQPTAPVLADLGSNE